MELDTTGQIISYEEYHPFGTTSYRSGRSETEVSQKRYKYCGKERDEETGLYYYGMRHYAAWLCRFINVDPLQFKYPYYTPYQYAGNKPISYIDLDGAEPVEPKIGVDVGTSEKPFKLPTVEITAKQTDGYVPSIPKFGYNGSALDYVAAIGNAGINILNIVPALWNSGVANFHSINRGTWGEDITNELQNTWSSIESWISNEYNYMTQTPIGEQALSTFKNLSSPQFVEFALPFVVGGAVSSFSKLTTVSKTTASTTTKVAAEAAKGGQMIVGEGMKRVSMKAEKCSNSIILNNMPTFTGAPYQVTSQMMTYNRQWILQQMRSGRPIIDIGLDLNRANPSIFY